MIREILYCMFKINIKARTRCHRCGEVGMCKIYPVGRTDFSTTIYGDVCSKCIQVDNLISKREKEEDDEEEKKLRKAWKKHRDRILKEDNKQ